jgi:hypothetical protein
MWAVQAGMQALLSSLGLPAKSFPSGDGAQPAELHLRREIVASVGGNGSGSVRSRCVHVQPLLPWGSFVILSFIAHRLTSWHDRGT